MAYRGYGNSRLVAGGGSVVVNSDGTISVTGVTTFTSLIHRKITATTGSDPLEVLRLEVSDDDNVNLGAGEGPSINFYVAEDSALSQLSAQVAAVREATADATASAGLVFLTALDDAAPTEKVRISRDGNVGIGVTTPSDKLEVVGDSSFSGSTSVKNVAEGNTGAVTQKTFRDSVTLTGATTDTSIAIPSGERLVAVALNVDTAVINSGDNTWAAAFITGSTTTVASAGTAAAQNTKINILLGDELTTGTTEVRFTPPSGTFSAGVIEIVVWTEALTALANA